MCGVIWYLGETPWVAHMYNWCPSCGEWNVCTDLYLIYVLALSTRLPHHSPITSTLTVFLMGKVFIFLLLLAARAELKLCHIMWLVWCFSLISSGRMIGPKSTSVRRGLDWYLKSRKWKIFLRPQTHLLFWELNQGFHSFFSQFSLSLCSDTTCLSYPDVTVSLARPAFNRTVLSCS